MVSKMSSLAQKRVVVPVSSVGSRFSSGPVGHADLEGLEPVEAVALDLDLDPLGQRVDHRDADAVQAAGDLVAGATELAAGVQHGEHDGDRGELLARRDVDRDAATVVGDLDGAVGEDRDLDAVAVAGQCLVDRVVHDLLHQVVQAALAGGADVHARALADRLETLEDLDRAGVVVAGLDRVALEDARGDHVGSRRVVGRRFGRESIGSGQGSLGVSCVLVGHEGFLFCCEPRARAGGGMSVMSGNTMAASQRVGDHAQSTLQWPTITACCPRMGGSGPKFPSEAQNRARTAVWGVDSSPRTGREGRSGPLLESLAVGRTDLSRRCPADPVP